MMEYPEPQQESVSACEISDIGPFRKVAKQMKGERFLPITVFTFLDTFPAKITITLARSKKLN